MQPLLALLSLLKLVPLRDWLYTALIASIIGYHVLSVSRAHSDGYDEAQAKCVAADQKARDEATANWIRTDDMLITLAQLNKDEIAQQLADMQTLVDKKQKVYKDHAISKPLPADCRLDDDRVRIANEAIR